MFACVQGFLEEAPGTCPPPHRGAGVSGYALRCLRQRFRCEEVQRRSEKLAWAQPHGQAHTWPAAPHLGARGPIAQRGHRPVLQLHSFTAVDLHSQKMAKSPPLAEAELGAELWPPGPRQALLWQRHEGTEAASCTDVGRSDPVALHRFSPRLVAAGKGHRLKPLRFPIPILNELGSRCPRPGVPSAVRKALPELSWKAHEP